MDYELRFAAVAASLWLACAGGDRERGAEARKDTRAHGRRTVSMNGMGHNAMGHNAMGHNGLASSGLGPSTVAPRCETAGNGGTTCTFDGNAEFRAWFAGNPGESEALLAYFVRCAYDAKTEITFRHRLKRHAWAGQFGLATTSLRAGRPMSADEGKWVAACLLAHVNTRGTRQYISLRGSPPGGSAALQATNAERWAMGYPEGVFAGDLFAEKPTYFTASLNIPPDWSGEWVPPNVALGRDLSFPGTFIHDGDGDRIPLNTHLGTYAELRIEHRIARCASPSESDDPDHGDDILATSSLCPATSLPSRKSRTPSRRGPQSSNCCDAPGELAYRPLFVRFARLANFESPRSGQQASRLVDVLVAQGSLPFEPSQSQECPGDRCIGQFSRRHPQPSPPGGKLTRLALGQAVDVVLYPPKEAMHIDRAETFTAIVHYANERPAPAVAEVQVANKDGDWTRLGAVAWPSTGGRDEFRWLQIYPVRPVLDAEGRPTLRLRIAGAARSESCTGEKLSLADGDRGTCRSSHWSWSRMGSVCDEQDPAAGPQCRGRLVSTWFRGWRCSGGGRAERACGLRDAPELDAAGFVPTSPTCVDGEASFAGVCPDPPHPSS